MSPGEGQDEIDIVIDDKLVDSLHKIEQADKIELGLVSRQAILQFDPFRLIFIGYLHIMFVIDVDDMEAGFEEVEDGFDGIDGNSVLYILKVRQQHYIFS